MPNRLFIVLTALLVAGAAQAAGSGSDDRISRLLVARGSDVPDYWGKDYVLPEDQCVPAKPGLALSALANAAFGTPHQKLVSVVAVLKSREQADAYYVHVVRRIGACMRRIVKRFSSFVSAVEPFRPRRYGERSSAARVRFSYRQNPRNRADWVVVRAGRLCSLTSQRSAA